MAITSTATRKAGPYTCNGATVAFPFNFKIFTAADLVATQTSAGVETILVSGFTVTLNANQDANPGGTLTMAVAPLAGILITLTSQVAYTQPMVLTNNGGFFATVLNDMADRCVMLVQQMLEKLNRAVTLPISTAANVNPQLPPPVANRGVKWDATGLALATTLYDPDTAATQSASSAAASLASQNAAAASAAASLAQLNTFIGQYYGPLAADPTADPLGGACTAGDLYFNTTTGYMRTFNASVWADYNAASAASAVIATAQAVIASAQAGISTAQAVIASAQAGLAATAKTASEVARDAANVNARVYPTTAAGLAATTTGQYFSVPSAASAEYLILYLNNAGVANEIKRYPSTAALAFKQPTNLASFEISDADGNLAIFVAVTATMTINAPIAVDTLGGLSTPGFAVAKRDMNNLVSFPDADGNIILAVDRAGRLVADFSLVPIPNRYKTGGVYDYEINHVFNYGQSLSVGQNTPAISTVQHYDNLMFTRGMRPQYDYAAESQAVWFAALVPAVEANPPTPNSLGETPSMGTGDMVKQLIASEDGLNYQNITYQLLLSNPGWGATTVTGLSRATAPYSLMISEASYGAALAGAANKTYAVQAVAWGQGESDYEAGTTQAAYTALLNTLVANFNTDIKAVTGQTKDIPLIAYQLASHKVNGATVPSIAMGLLDAETANPLVHIATPMYHFEYQDVGNNHITALSSRWLGAYYGLAYKRIVVDGINWRPLKPLSSIKSGKIAVVKFNVPSGRLTLDTTNVLLNTNYGFELVDSGGTPLTISSVAISGPNSVKIVAAATIPAGAKLRYAWSGAGNVGNTVGPRGNLRDTQGDSIVFDPNGINKPMHNWCIIFEIGV